MKTELLISYLIIAMVSFLGGTLFGIFYEKLRCQKKINKILDEALDEINKSRGEK